MTIHNKLSPNEQRIQTKLVNLARENLHRNCSINIKQAGPHWGLYCANPKCRKTGAWIDWIKKDQVKQMLKKELNKL
jgi:hypothetical protein